MPLIEDMFPDDNCAAQDTDEDGFPDEFFANGCTTTNSFTRADAFPDDPCASLDTDGDGFPNEIVPDDGDEMLDADETALCNAYNAASLLANPQFMPLVEDPNRDEACLEIDRDRDGIPDIVFTTMNTCSIVASQMIIDVFPDDPCASLDTDSDGFPDEIVPDNNDGMLDADETALCNAYNANLIAPNMPLIADMFLMDNCAAQDSDGDGVPDEFFADAEGCDTSTYTHSDAFPEDPCANIDTDEDNFPKCYFPRQ